MREIDRIIVHCAYTPADMDIGVAEIERWHKDRGWNQVGYHYVIRRDGTVERGRDEGVQGAHVRGHNHDSIGVCLVGGKPEFNFTWAQLTALRNLVYELQDRHPNITIHGHNEFDASKTCPTFNTRELFYA